MPDASGPHALSAPAHAALDRLTRSTGELLGTLDAVAANLDPATVAGRSEVAIIVRRYLALLAEGRAADDAGIALRGANLLTTLAKRAGNAEPAGADGRFATHVLIVIRNAIDAARTLRVDVGLPF
jgi:hypothetical protein